MYFLPTTLPSLNKKRLVIGVCGGIAAYKTCELIRLLIKHGAQVKVVMTESARQFIQPLTFQALTGNPVYLSQWSPADDGASMPHIDLGRWADALLVAPCTANTLAKIANGFAGNLLENLILARKCKVAIAPAMNVEMWQNKATQRNLQLVTKDNILVFGPNFGDQACGEIGLGRQLESQELLLELAKLLTTQTLTNIQVLLTAGPTYENIDPVRALTNLSSGKMGYNLALVAWLRGATVNLITGPTALNKPYQIKTINVNSAKEMHQAVMTALQTQPTDFFFGVAAVADYYIKNPSTEKQKKPKTGLAKLDFELDYNPDILAYVSQYRDQSNNDLTVVGFAAETSKVEQYAQDKLILKNTDFIVANLAQKTMGSDYNCVKMYQKEKNNPVMSAEGCKFTIAQKLFDFIESQYETADTTKNT